MSDPRIAEREFALWAQPVIGGADGEHVLATRADERARIRFLLAALGLMGLLGVALQAPCLREGWDPAFGFAHVCETPLIAQYLEPGSVGLGGTALSTLLGWVAGLAGGAADFSYASLAAMMNLLGLAFIGLAVLRITRSSWYVLALALSPVVVFGVMGSFDPIALALALWATVVLLEDRGPVLAGVLLALAASISPLALPVLLGLLVALDLRARAAVRRSPDAAAMNRLRGRALAFAGITILGASAMYLADPLSGSWLRAWAAPEPGGGSLLGLLATLRVPITAPIAAVILVISLLSATLVLLLVLRARIDRGEGSSALVPVVVLLALSLLLSGAMPSSGMLWLLAFAVPVLRHWWLHAGWMALELLWAVSSSLNMLEDRTSVDGLPDHLAAPVTALRIMLVILVAGLVLRPAARPRVRRAAPEAPVPPGQPEAPHQGPPQGASSAGSRPSPGGPLAPERETQVD